MLIVTSEQMKQLEQSAVAQGIGLAQLMENAGGAAAALIARAYPISGCCVTVFCGNGNNGGDGFVTARRLCEAGADVAVLLTDGVPRTAQAAAALERLAGTAVTVANDTDDPAYLAERLAETDLLIDAIYGIGFHGALDERHRGLCRLMNGVGVPVCALDIPSGVVADSGSADEEAVRAAMTIVFDCDKPATVLPATAEFCGEVAVAGIGIPQEAHDAIRCSYWLIERDWVFARLQKRRRDSHKGTYGRLLNIAGSRTYMGAAALSTLAALRTGAGYVTLASTEEVCRAAFPLLPEAVLLPLAAGENGALSRAAFEVLATAADKSDAILIGNGLGTEEDVCALVYELLKTAHCPLIIDADGINALARHIDILEQASCPVVLTPHLAELSRLTALPLAQLERDPLTAGMTFARKYGVTVVLKGAYTNTVTADGTVYSNTTGNAGLAKAGSGDVLAGMIGALAAQGYPPETAAACGVFLHGLAGDYAARTRSQYGMLARDVIEALTEVFLDNDR